ncbi:hypothetical protein QEH56_23815 [Pelagicoccus enzymogenes]|uniref:hypothetical protein n=1 Tax=Pelagicoccus enzymogenes TaxID=2773457 RepID=UPI0028102F21|nr:hypothetical protein [Pelagicoccus enzymogenes]MDQ8201213.1 hypothetical protein [Pelagicoccus enzymogenes]
MQKEIEAVNGDPDSLDSKQMADHILNVRFRVENVDTKADYLPDTNRYHNRHRYSLYDFENEERENLTRALATQPNANGAGGYSRKGTTEISEPGKLFRKGTKPTSYTPEHQLMQNQLFAELESEYGKGNVILEENYVDVIVDTEDERIYFELKSDLSPRSVLRQSIGQLLEYAYYPGHSAKPPTKLVVVGRAQLDEQDEVYLSELRKLFKLPLDYRVVKI